MGVSIRVCTRRPRNFFRACDHEVIAQSFKLCAEIQSLVPTLRTLDGTPSLHLFRAATWKQRHRRHHTLLIEVHRQDHREDNRLHRLRREGATVTFAMCLLVEMNVGEDPRSCMARRQAPAGRQVSGWPGFKSDGSGRSEPLTGLLDWAVFDNPRPIDCPD